MAPIASRRAGDRPVGDSSTRYQALADRDEWDSEETTLLSASRASDSEHAPDERRAKDLKDVPASQHEIGGSDGPTFRGRRHSGETLTVYQRKSELVNRALDESGMGRYQWCIFFLCGAGYFLDLAWAQLFGLIASRFAQEFGVPKSELGFLFSAFSVGLTVGAFFWGLMTDVYGRKWCFNLTCLVASIAGMVCIRLKETVFTDREQLIAVPSNFTGVAILTCFVGFGVGGNIPIDATVTLEFLPTDHRWLLAALSTFQPLGVVVTTLIAYAFIPKYSCETGLPACSSGLQPCCTKGSNLGWRFTAITVGCITLGTFVLRYIFFDFRESPKYLLTLGKDQEAIDVVHSLAAFNKRPMPDLTIEDFEQIDAEDSQIENGGDDGEPLSKKELARQTFFSNIKRLKSLKGAVDTPVMAWMSAVLFVAYISLFWSFTIAGGYLPIILADKGVDLSQTLEETYRSYIWIYLPGVLGTLAAAALMEARGVGRRLGMIIGSAAMSATLFCYPFVNSLSGNIALNSVEYVMQSLYGALLYAFTPEAFPAPLRGSVCGILSTCGRLSGIIAPTAAARVYSEGSSGVLYMAGAGALISTVAIALVPFDTANQQTY